MIAKKKAPKKDISNEVIAMVLVMAILVSLAGTFVVVESLSGTSLKIIEEDGGTSPLAPSEPVSNPAQISLTVQKPLNEVNKK